MNTNMKKSRHPVEKIVEVFKYKELGMTHKQIAYKVFGKESMQSTVGDLLRDYGFLYDIVGDNREGEPQLLYDTDARIYCFDIETAPILAYCWGLFKQNIGIRQIKEDWYPLMFSYKPLGEDVVNVSLTSFDGYESGRDNEEQLVRACWRLFDDADILIAHNGVQFDKKKMNAKFIEFGLPKPSPYKVVDTLKIYKGNFNMTSGKLDYLMQKLCGDRKVDTGGIELWLDCMNGDLEAWDNMITYCNKDVTGLEEVYLLMRAWDARHPNVSLGIDDGEHHCIVCGGTEFVELDKTANTGTSSFPSIRCTNCNHVQRTKQNIRNKDQMKNTLMNIPY